MLKQHPPLRSLLWYAVLSCGAAALGACSPDLQPTEPAGPATDRDEAAGSVHPSAIGRPNVW